MLAYMQLYHKTDAIMQLHIILAPDQNIRYTVSMNHGEKAVELFCSGYNCAQSVAGAFADDELCTEKAALRLMAGFGGGMGGMREMCGAVSGMIFALGMDGGNYDPHDTQAKTKLYTRVREAVALFKEKYETTNCRELLLKAGCLPKPDPSVRNAEYYSKRPCAHFVEYAAIIAQRLNDKQKNPEQT